MPGTNDNTYSYLPTSPNQAFLDVIKALTISETAILNPDEKWRTILNPPSTGFFMDEENNVLASSTPASWDYLC